MANLTLSGYLTTAISVSFTGTQTLNSLTDNEWTDLSDEIDNGTNKYAWVDLYLELGSAAFAGTDSGIEIYIVPSVDGSNYPSWSGNSTSDAQQNNAFFVAFLSTTATTAAQKMATPPHAPVRLPSGKYKYGVRNRGNVTLAGSANTLYWRPHSFAA